MSYDAERLAIEQRFKTNWGSTTPVAWTNVPFIPPANAEWVRLTILNGDTSRINIGPQSLQRQVGVITVSCFTPEGKGSSRARVLADLAAAIFREANFSGILCRAPAVRDVGPSGAYFQVNMTVAFQRDETFA